ncbi:polysaccharide pyruvyl transferase family protein [Gaoshiqia sp. Z1-71]|uniref:polysaccharide pyruvyl transferase family protein n=1 Tax=Gaoshiqia hydrogeniformans TaxID=3290090 RepID=UPI003BF84C1D
MKIGIFTFFGTLNFGVNMQALSVYQVLQTFYPNDDIEFINVQRVSKKRYRPALRNANLKSILLDFRRIRLYKDLKNSMRYSEMALVTKNYVDATDYVIKQHYDRIYVGADTVLEFQPYNTKGNVPYFWLSDSIKAKKFFLSASARGLNVDDIDSISLDVLKDNIRDFNLLGVRDEATFDVIVKLVPEKKIFTSIIPDPTFLYDIDYTHAQRYAKRKGLDRDNWVFLHVKTVEKWVIEFIEMAKQGGYKIASLTYVKGIDKLINDMGPLEHAGIFRYFKFAVTHRFHDSVFCFKNKVPVVACFSHKLFSSHKGHSKYSNLFSYFGYEKIALLNSDAPLTGETVMKSVSDLTAVYSMDIVTLKLGELRESLDSYIRSTLNK